jgi:hypothetical protein
MREFVVVAVDASGCRLIPHDAYPTGEAYLIEAGEAEAANVIS